MSVTMDHTLIRVGAIILLPAAIVSIFCLTATTPALALPLPCNFPSTSSLPLLRQHHRTSSTLLHLYYPLSGRRSCCSILHHFHQRNRLSRQLAEGLTASSSDKNNADNEDAEDHDKGNNTSKKVKTSAIGGVTGRIEGMVRAVGLTDETYKFGDFTRRAVSDVARVSEDAVRTVTGNEEYQFGDITKNITQVAVNVTEDTIRSISGDQSYQFGDLTKSVVSEVADSAENFLLETDVNVALIIDLVSNIYSTLPSSGLVGRFFRELGQRHPNDDDNDTKNNNNSKSAMTTSLQLVAFIGLTLHFVLNMCHSGNIISAWGYTWWSMGESPLKSQATWQLFLSAQTTLRIFVGPLILPVQAALTFFLSVIYRDFVVIFLEQRILSGMPWWGTKMKNRYPVLTRFVALFLAYFLGNCLSVAALTFMGCSSVGAVCRLAMG